MLVFNAVAECACVSVCPGVAGPVELEVHSWFLGAGCLPSLQVVLDICYLR